MTTWMASFSLDSISLSVSSFADKRSDDILEDNIQRNNKVTSPSAASTNGHNHNPGRRKSASGLIENGNSEGGGGLKAPIAQDEDLDSNCNEDDDHGNHILMVYKLAHQVVPEFWLLYS